MWCGDCQQDVPGIAGRAGSHTVQCARCSTIISQSAGAAAKNPAMLDFEDWDLEDELKQADRLLAKVRRGSDGASIRLDDPHETATAPFSRGMRQASMPLRRSDGVQSASGNASGKPLRGG